ncbi:hypothetical protein SAMN03159343_3959 [Klenkia marina]|uniref:Uncharacterized protein n=1 Tax=Klenkia marina TaxID=1960309 RepID=A0A1G4Z1J1_9ACTN|nr:hypothetical protein [Klenkia marina]SCX59573.1 hypothetical protein SAMN03159343_3959 [Klenkia marina]
MTHPPASDSPAGTARATLPDEQRAGFDRLVHAVTAARGKALGAVLRGQLPGVEGVRWLRSEGLPPTVRAAALTPGQWLSLHATWLRLEGTPHAGVPQRGGGKASTTHGHAPGAQAAPRWF